MLREYTKRQIRLVLILILLSTGLTACSQSLKGLYVDDFFSIIGNQVEEDALLSYANSNGFNYLILYNAARIHREKYPLDNRHGSSVWKHFINRAKTEYNIDNIGVVGEKAASFIPTNSYNQLVDNDPMYRIDVYNLEFEFWNKRLLDTDAYYCTTYLNKQGYSCTNEGAFAFYLEQLKQMQKLKGNSDIEIETYIGNPTDAQLAEIAKVTDRLLIHYYREKTERIALYKLNRLLVLQKTNPTLKIAPIFSSRENHSGPWLKTHKIDDLPTLFFNQLKSVEEIDLKSLNFEGYVWYRYSNMPKAD